MRYLAVAFLLIIATRGFADEVERGMGEQQALNNLAHEFAECAGYFMVVSNAPRIKNEEPDVAKRYKQSAERLLLYSAELTTEEKASARAELAVKGMARKMDKNWSNISIVMNQYAYPCKDLAENPQKRLRELLR